MFQKCIISLNQKELPKILQIIALTGNYAISILTLIQGNYIIQSQQNKNFEYKLFVNMAFPYMFEYFNVNALILQVVFIVANLMVILLFFLSWKYKQLESVIIYIWYLHPYIYCQLVLQFEAYQLFESNSEFILAIIDIVLTILIKLFIKLYTFRQNDSQYLMRMNIDETLIPLYNIIIALLSGIQLQTSYFAYLHLIFIILIDIIQGPKYFITLLSEYELLITNYYSKFFQLIRLFIAIMLIFIEIQDVITIMFIGIPVLAKIFQELWKYQILKHIFQINSYFSEICVEKAMELRNEQVESYLTHIFYIQHFQDPINRILMLSFFCNHMSLCRNIDCFCQNKHFVENILIKTDLDVDIKAIQQSINYQLGSKEILQCYQQLIVMFIVNYCKRINLTQLHERLVINLTLFEIKYFQTKLFATKIRFNKLKLQYSEYHPNLIKRRATALLTNTAISQYMKFEQTELNIQDFIKIHKKYDEVKIKLKSITELKLELINLIISNYQNPVPYLLTHNAGVYVKNITSTEKDIQTLINFNPHNQEFKQIFLNFYSYLKVDYFTRSKIRTNAYIPLEDKNQKSFALAKYQNGKLYLSDYPRNFQDITKINASLVGADVELLMPPFIREFHQRIVNTLIYTGKSQLLKRQYAIFLLQIKEYIEEVNIILRVDYSQINSLQFIALFKLMEKQDPLFIASSNGKIHGFTSVASNLFGLDKTDIYSANFYFLSPDLKKGKAYHFESFLLIPRKRIDEENEVDYYRYFLNSPQDCFVYFINAEYFEQEYQFFSYCALRIHQQYKLQIKDYKYVALDIMLKLAMMKNKIRKGKYKTTLNSLKQITEFRNSTQHINTIDSINEDDYEEDHVPDSVCKTPIKPQKYPTPELLTSLINLDSNRSQQNENLLFDQQFCSYANSLESLNNTKQVDQLAIKEVSQEQEEDNEESDQTVEVEVEIDDDVNIYDQIQIIAQQMKVKERRKIQKKSITKKKKSQITSTLSETQVNQHLQISKLVNYLNDQKHSRIDYLRLIGILTILINLACVFIIVVLFKIEFDGVQTDSENQCYPQKLNIDLNSFLIGIELYLINVNNWNLSYYFINESVTQYTKESIFVNDQQFDYHDFLKLLDSENMTVQKDSENITYGKRYFFKTIMIEYLSSFKQYFYLNQTDKTEEQFIINNFLLLCQELIHMEIHTRDDVKARLDFLNQLGVTILIVSILSNTFIIAILTMQIVFITKYKNKLLKQMFLFNNLNVFVQILTSNTGSKSVFQMKNQKIQSLTSNKRIRRLVISKFLLIILLLFSFSLGFYIPLYLYVDNQETKIIDINQVGAQFVESQLGISTQLQKLLSDSLGIFENQNQEVLTRIINESTNADHFILYEVPYSSTFSEIKIFQTFSQDPICDCTLLNGSLKNGYLGFFQYIQSFLQGISDYSFVTSNSNQLLEIYQAFILVYQNQNQLYQDIINVTRQTTDSITSSILLLAIISQIFILIFQIILVFICQKILQKWLKEANQLLYLFTPQQIIGNKYIHSVIAKRAKF